MRDALPVLAFDGVQCVSASGAGLTVERLVLQQSRVMVVHAPPRDENLPPVCDLAAGLVAPARGVVRFMGEDWRDVGTYRQSVMRGCIGRVFGGLAWVSNLSVAENVLLPQRHHTNRSEEDILREASRLARETGLGSLPADRPENLRPHDLARWQWVRAMLGNPRLLLLEEPEAASWEEHRPLLRERVLRLAEGGGAVLWVTREPDAWRDGCSPAVLHAGVADGNLSLELESR